MLFDFSRIAAVEPWRAIDDRIMGGVSQSEIVTTESKDNAKALFRGKLSQQNNGGFCSIRASLDKPVPPELEHLWIRCHNSARWSKKTFYLNVRTDIAFDGVNYRVGFSPTNQSTTFEFTAIEFKPVFRGRTVSDAPQLQFSDVRQIGLMIADAQLGDFELFVCAIGAA
jgi:hypothetical protein